MRGWKISMSRDIAMRVLLLLTSIFVSDVCHVLPSKILAILSILNHSLNWPVPFARELNDRLDGGHAYDVDKNRVNGTEARLLDRRHAIWIWGVPTKLSVSLHRIVRPAPPIRHYN